MRGFVIVWLAAFGIVTLMASGVTWYVAKNAPPPVTPIAKPAGPAATATPVPPFSRSDAVDVVVLRLPHDAAGEAARKKLQSSATVIYHSPQHWRVCVDNACWVAHGPGRYAEPENEAARSHEAGGQTPH
jgi:hypothetical protein